MPFAIWFEDRPGSADLRARLRGAHIDYMRSNLARTIASGGLLSDDGETAHGGLIMVDCATEREARAFQQADPFYRGGLFADPIVLGWHERRASVLQVSAAGLACFAVIDLPAPGQPTPPGVWSAHEDYAATAPAVLKSGWAVDAAGNPAGEIAIIAAASRAEADDYACKDPLSGLRAGRIRAISRWRLAFMDGVAFL